MTFAERHAAAVAWHPEAERYATPKTCGVLFRRLTDGKLVLCCLPAPGHDCAHAFSADS